MKILATESLIARVTSLSPSQMIKRGSTNGIIMGTILSWEKFIFSILRRLGHFNQVFGQFIEWLRVL